jgi:hypothetical protein
MRRGCAADKIEGNRGAEIHTELGDFRPCPVRMHSNNDDVLLSHWGERERGRGEGLSVWIWKGVAACRGIELVHLW